MLELGTSGQPCPWIKHPWIVAVGTATPAAAAAGVDVVVGAAVVGVAAGAASTPGSGRTKVSSEMVCPTSPRAITAITAGPESGCS